MGGRPSSRGLLVFLEPEVKRSGDRWIINTSFSDNVRIGVSINIRDAKIESIEGTDF
jgi:hypothetical protein